MVFIPKIMINVLWVVTNKLTAYDFRKRKFCIWGHQLVPFQNLVAVSAGYGVVLLPRDSPLTPWPGEKVGEITSKTFCTPLVGFTKTIKIIYNNSLEVLCTKDKYYGFLTRWIYMNSNRRTLSNHEQIYGVWFEKVKSLTWSTDLCSVATKSTSIISSILSGLIVFLLTLTRWHSNTV